MLDSLCFRSFKQLEEIKFVNNICIGNTVFPSNRLKPLSNVLILEDGVISPQKWGCIDNGLTLSTVDIKDIVSNNTTNYKPIVVPVNGFIIIINEKAFFLKDKDELFLLAAVKMIENDCFLIVTNSEYCNYPVIIQTNSYNHWINSDFKSFTDKICKLDGHMISNVVLRNDLYEGEECVSDRSVEGVCVPIDDIYYPIIEAADNKCNEENKKQNWFFMDQLV